MTIHRMSSWLKQILLVPVGLLAIWSVVVGALPLDEETQNTLFELGFIDLTQYGRSIFGEPDNETGEKLARYNPDVDGGNPEELGSYLEGDILMPLGQARNGLSATSARWPGGIVPYEIRGSFGELKNLLYVNGLELIGFIRRRRVSNEVDRAGFQSVSQSNVHSIPATIQ